MAKGCRTALRARGVAVMGLLAAAAGAARANGPLIQSDFDAVRATFAYGYAYNGATSTQGEAAGTGVGGSNAYRVLVDGTNSLPFFYGFGGGAGQIPPVNFTRPNSLSEFTYSGAFYASGALAGVTSTTLQLELQVKGPDGPDADSDLDNILVLPLERTFNPNGTYQVVTGDFGSATPTTGSLAALQAAFDAGQVQQIQLNVNVPNGLNDFGRDTDNVFGFDNILVGQGAVPEPGVLGLGAVGGLALAGRRRRRLA